MIGVGNMLKRVEHIGDQTLILGDCREVMPTLGRFDACVTDPPYGVNYEGSATKKHGKNGVSYDSYDDTPENIFLICVPAIRKAVSICDAAVVTPGNASAFYYDVPRSMGAIYYPSGANCGPWGFVCSQPLFYYGDDPYLAKGLGSRPNAFAANATTEAIDRNIGHPCTKPIKQVQWLVSRVSFERQTILDPFMGSGTTLVACQQLGRKGTGIELSEKYFDIACRRVEQAAAQPRLFVEPVQKPKQEALL